MGNKKLEIDPKDEKILKAIGARVKELRKKTGDSYEVFAIKNEVNRISQYRLENGGNFNMSTLLKVLRGLGISPEKFFKNIN